MTESASRIPYIRLDIDATGEEAIVAEVDGTRRAKTVYCYDREGARHSSGPRRLQEETTIELARALDIPSILRVDHSLIEKVIDEKDARACFPAFYAERRM